MNMLRKVRLTLGMLCLVFVTLLFVDFTGPSGAGTQEDALHVFQAEKLAALRCAGSVCAGDAVGCACPGSLARPVCRVRPCGTQLPATFVDVGKQPAGFYGRTHGQLCLLFGGCLAQESAGADSGSGHAGTGSGTGGTQRTYLL